MQIIKRMTAVLAAAALLAAGVCIAPWESGGSVAVSSERVSASVMTPTPQVSDADDRLAVSVQSKSIDNTTDETMQTSMAEHTDDKTVSSESVTTEPSVEDTAISEMPAPDPAPAPTADVNEGVTDGENITVPDTETVKDTTVTVTRSHRVEGEEGCVSVEMILSGEQADSVSLAPTAAAGLLPDTMPGFIGAYDLAVDGDFESATLTFEMPTAAGSVTPTFYYFSEDTQTLESVETTVDGNTVTATVDTAATYVLLDRVVYEGSLTWEDTWGAADVYTAVEVVLVIDDSGSMTQTDPDDQRLSVAAELIGRLPENSKVGVVRFATQIERLTPTLTADKDAACAVLTTHTFKSHGVTKMYTAVSDGLTLFESYDDYTQRVMVVISDGLAVDAFEYDAIVSAMTEQDITLYTVGLDGSQEVFLETLQAFAADAGGTYHYAADADALAIVYDDIARLIDITTDTDGDTIPDYYEDNLIAFNGVHIPLDKTRADTDFDGVPDNEEVSVELVYSEDGTQVYVKGVLLSDPTLSDTDGDGTADDTDEAPYDNTFTGTLTTAYATSSVSFVMDYGWFSGDNTVYCADLAKVSSLFSSVAYAENSLSLSDALGVRTTDGQSVAALLSFFGMQAPQTYILDDDYDDIHLSEVTVGYRNITADGELKTVLAVVVRGTNGTLAEWSSNCDIGDLAVDTDTDDWVNTLNHKGFDVAATRIMRFAEQYIAEQALHEDALVYWVTGHSRGAGIANIIGADLERDGRTAFTYTFAAPNTTLADDAASYATIFNIINADDFVPCLPIDVWGYTRYGVSTDAVSVKESYETAWEDFTGIFDYNPDGSNMDSCISALAGIITAGADPRLDCYRYTCACHGDGSNDTVTITNTGMSESSRDKAIAKIPSNALPYCTVTAYEGGFLGGWDFDVCQTPAYFMQLLAAFMGGEIDAYRFGVELNIADRFENAKTALIAVGISGVEHPHYTETYYVLSCNITATDFA